MVAAVLVPAPMDRRMRRAGTWAASATGLALLVTALWLASAQGGAVAAGALGLSLASPALLWAVFRHRDGGQADRLGAVALLLLSLPWAFLEPVVSAVHVVGAVVVLVLGRPRTRRRTATRAVPTASPASVPTTPAPPFSIERRLRVRRPRILLVEDNPANRFYGSLVLRRLGHPFDVVSSGEQAVAAVQARRYDVVLMDVRMPGMDGLAATDAIRARVPPHLRPAVVALTADDRPEARRDLMQRGMDGYLSKPLRQEALVEVLERMTGQPMVVAR